MGERDQWTRRQVAVAAAAGTGSDTFRSNPARPQGPAPAAGDK
jgi:hypothetical protein